MAKKKAVEKKEEEPVAKVLTNAQLKIIEAHSRWMDLNRLEHKCSTLLFENKRLQAQIELQELKTKSEMLKKAIDDKIETHKGQLKIIADKLKITGKWSFDPETGEVMED